MENNFLYIFYAICSLPFPFSANTFCNSHTCSPNRFFLSLTLLFLCIIYLFVLPASSSLLHSNYSPPILTPTHPTSSLYISPPPTPSNSFSPLRTLGIFKVSFHFLKLKTSKYFFFLASF